MKKTILYLPLLVLVSAACSVPGLAAPATPASVLDSAAVESVQPTLEITAFQRADAVCGKHPGEVFSEGEGNPFCDRICLICSPGKQPGCVLPVCGLDQ